MTAFNKNSMTKVYKSGQVRLKTVGMGCSIGDKMIDLFDITGQKEVPDIVETLPISNKIETVTM